MTNCREKQDPVRNPLQPARRGGMDMQDRLRMAHTGALDIVQSTVGAPSP
jgi:hypothetical protein